MITLYSGTPGSGKSLNGAAKVRSWLKWYGPVIGTFHINKECLYKNSKYEYTYVNIYDLKPQFLVEFARKNRPKKKNPEGSFLLIIDESQRIFNSRAWNAKDRNDWITFFAEHRHLGFDIILISHLRHGRSLILQVSFDSLGYQIDKTGSDKNFGTCIIRRYTL